jgi:hypothetical protein
LAPPFGDAGFVEVGVGELFHPTVGLRGGVIGVDREAGAFAKDDDFAADAAGLQDQVAVFLQLFRVHTHRTYGLATGCLSRTGGISLTWAGVRAWQSS